MAENKRSNPKSKKSEEQRLVDEYVRHAENNDLVSAIETLDKLVPISKMKSIVYSVKADTLSQLGRQSEALEAANLAIQYPNPPSKLYKLRAELLVSLGQSTEDLQDALNSIDQALQLYDQEGMNEDLQAPLDNVESFRYWFSEKTKSRTEMASLRADVKSLLYSLTLHNRVQEIEANLARDKVKTVELMAIFTAVLALIFANVQFFFKVKPQRDSHGKCLLSCCNDLDALDSATDQFQQISLTSP